MDKSKHAEKMSQCRGITMANLELHQKFADREAFVGSGCTSWTISPKETKAMIDGGVSAQVVDKIRRIAVVYGQNGKIVTLLPMIGGKAKNYTRGARRRSHGRAARNSKECLRRRYRG